MRFYSRLRLLINHNLQAVRLRTWLFLRQNPNLYVVKKNHTEICIEGFPRSANSFSVYLFARANPQVKLAHHTHAIINVKKAVEWDIPTIVLIRDPVDAITSAYLYQPSNLDYYTTYYIEFYTRLIQIKSEVVIGEFNRIVNGEFNNIIQQVNETYRTSFDPIKDLEKTSKEIMAFLKKPEYYTGTLKMKQSVIARRMQAPHPEKEDLKKQIQPRILKHPDIKIAQAIYQEIIS